MTITARTFTLSMLLVAGLGVSGIALGTVVAGSMPPRARLPSGYLSAVDLQAIDEAARTTAPYGKSSRHRASWSSPTTGLQGTVMATSTTVKVVDREPCRFYAVVVYPPDGTAVYEGAMSRCLGN